MCSDSKESRIISPFDKYRDQGAYHWREVDPTSPEYNPPVEARYEVVVRRLKNRAGLRLLDLGCGDGYLLSRVEPGLELVVGLDAEPLAVRLARTKLRNRKTRLVLGSCLEIPFGDGEFDVVLCTDVIEHLSQPERCLLEIRRVLKPEGRLLLTTPKWRPDRQWDWRHEREYTPEDLDTLLSSHFSQIHLSFFWPMSWSRIHSNRFGWHLVPVLSRYWFNPFLKEGKNPERFGQILAECKP